MIQKIFIHILISYLFLRRATPYSNERANLEEIPHAEIDQKREKTLDLDYNKLTSIGDYEFGNYTSLQSAYFSRNRLTQVADTAFVNTNLKTLYLLGNRIQQFPNISLICKTLQRLDISENRISVIPNGSFDGCVKLRYLHVNYNMLRNLDVLEWSALELPILENIYCTHNVLKSVPQLGGLLKIGRLQVNGNHLKDYISNNSGIFNGTTTINTIIINKNEITTFPNISATRSTLRLLEVVRNRITYIPEGTFDGFISLAILRLSENPLFTIPELSTAAATLETLELNWIGLTYFDIEVAKTLSNLRTLTLKGIYLKSMMNFTVLNQTIRLINLNSADVLVLESEFFPVMDYLVEVSFEDGRVHCVEQPGPLKRRIQIMLTFASLNCTPCWGWTKSDTRRPLEVNLYAPQHGKLCKELGPERLADMTWGEITEYDLEPLTTTAVLPSSTVLETTSTLRMTTVTFLSPETSKETTSVGESDATSSTSVKTTTSYTTMMFSTNTSTSSITSTISMRYTTATAPWWGEWGGWGECSSSCGMSIQTRIRVCSSSIQQCPLCDGRRSEHNVCSQHACPTQVHPEDKAAMKTKAFFAAPELTEADRRPSACAISGLAIGIVATLGIVIIIVDAPTIITQFRRVTKMKRNR